jgi:hypothetical protein
VFAEKPFVKTPPGVKSLQPRRAKTLEEKLTASILSKAKPLGSAQKPPFILPPPPAETMPPVIISIDGFGTLQQTQAWVNRKWKRICRSAPNGV